MPGKGRWVPATSMRSVAEHVEEPGAGRRGLGRVGVEDDAGLGMAELHRRQLRGVAEDQDLRVARGQAEAGMPDRVAGQRHRW